MESESQRAEVIGRWCRNFSAERRKHSSLGARALLPFFLSEKSTGEGDIASAALATQGNGLAHDDGRVRGNGHTNGNGRVRGAPRHSSDFVASEKDPVTNFLGWFSI